MVVGFRRRRGECKTNPSGKGRPERNPKAIALYLTKSLAKDELEPLLKALNQILIGQNVMAVARKTGIRRTALYRSFGREINPPLGRVLALLGALNVRLVAVPRLETPTEARPPEKADLSEDQANRIALDRSNRGLSSVK